jgi:hypothetical protein
MIAGAVFCTALSAQVAPKTQGGIDVCSLATNAEFQQAYEVDPRIGIIPDDPVPTEMVWGPHCDYSDGSIDLFTKKTPSAELDRVLGLTKGGKQRTPVQGLGDRAFFTTIYPDDKYRHAGFLAVFIGPRILTLSMDPHEGEALEATRPRLERLAKLVLPRVK